MTQRRRVKGDKPYRLLLEQNPPQKRKRPHWSSRRLLPVEIEHLTKDVTRTASIRRRFYAFSTKPNWAGIAGAQRGAHVALIEAERSPRQQQQRRKAA